MKHVAQGRNNVVIISIMCSSLEIDLATTVLSKALISSFSGTTVFLFNFHSCIILSIVVLAALRLHLTARTSLSKIMHCTFYTVIQLIICLNYLILFFNLNLIKLFLFF